MSTVERLLPVEAHGIKAWQRYLLDSVLASAGALSVTAIISIFHLYPRIPNISIVYLLVVIALASTRGRYAAILASLVAFLSFDFFIVPPLFTLVMYRIEEWIALFVFLVDAILTGQLAATLRVRAREASRREHEVRTLYDLVRSTNGETMPERQLEAIVRAVVDALSPLGVHDCAILQPDGTGIFRVQVSAYQPTEQITLSTDEQTLAAWVIAHDRIMSLYDDAVLAVNTSAHFVQRILLHKSDTGRAVGRSLCLIPLKLGEKVVGVLRLRVFDDSHRLTHKGSLEEEVVLPRTSFFWIFLDQVTALIERARLQQENLRIEILQRTDALRAALLSSVSHDLRTPLTSIKTAASSLLQEDVQWDDATRRSFAQSIEREADRLNRLVGNLLDMSRIEEGALKPEKELYSLKTLIYDVLARMQPLLAGRAVRKQLPPDDLLQLELDYLQIDQVLTNLVENAVRYTPAGSPIDVSVHREGEEVVISVADRGPGIPAADLERVFDKFYRVVQGRHPPGYPMGSGLGLAVCKGLVEAHGGRIWAQLREGGGLVVFVTLPWRSKKGREDEEARCLDSDRR
jgi:two-component system, OmpR family, sensor histidine kinase KdpD